MGGRPHIAGGRSPATGASTNRCPSVELRRGGGRDLKCPASSKFVADYHNGETIWSSPALYRVPGQSLDDIFVGLDKTQAAAQGGCVGGVFDDLRWEAAGAAGKGSASASVPAGLAVVHQSGCQGAPPGKHRGQAIWSSPAIGSLDGRLVVSVGTSFYDEPYGAGTDALYVYPVDPSTSGTLEPLWTAPTPGPVLGSPAIGEVSVRPSGREETAIVDTSFACPATNQTQPSCLRTNVSAVQAWVLETVGRSTKLALLWRRDLPGGDSLTSPVLVPLLGEHTNDVLVGASGGLFPLSGGSGAFLFGTATRPPQLSINSSCRLFNTPAVADVDGTGDYSGWYAFELCSNGAATTGGLYAFRLPDPPGVTPAWLMFRGDPSHTGVSWTTLGAVSPRGDPTTHAG